MNELDRLIAKREQVRLKEKELTRQIKNKRREQSKKYHPSSTLLIEAHKATILRCEQLQKENANLRQSIAYILRLNGDTYKKIGGALGVSAVRARQLSTKMHRRLSKQVKVDKANEPNSL